MLRGYNECSLNIMITTPSLFANKGAFSSCITNDRWCGTIKVIYSFPFFWFIPEQSGGQRAFLLPLDFSPSSPLPFFFFNLPLGWTRAPNVRQHLPPDQSGTLGNAWLFQVTGTPLGGLEPTFMEWNSGSWRQLPARLPGWPGLPEELFTPLVELANGANSSCVHANLETSLLLEHTLNSCKYLHRF